MNKSIKKLIVFIRHNGEDVPLGQLVKLTGDVKPSQRRSQFTYARSWLERDDKIDIDPRSLPLKKGDTFSGNYQVPLAFHDAGPDGFGQSVLGSAYPTIKFGAMEYLACAGPYRTGAFSFGFDPNKGPEVWQPEAAAIALPDDETTRENIIIAAEAVMDGEATQEHLQWLLKYGSSSVGGARPKARFQEDDGEWIAKFSMSEDQFNDPRLEAVCLSLAQHCAIDVPEHKVIKAGNKTMLLVRRFDRSEDAQRWYRYISAGTLLDTGPNTYRTDYTYADMAATARQAGIKACDGEIFRRLLFNCFIHNTDDHLRNTGFIGDENGWRISPAFDLVPQFQDHLVMAPAKGASARPDPAQVFSDAWPNMDITNEEAKTIYEEVVSGLSVLPELFDKYEVIPKDRETVAGLMKYCFNPPVLG